MTVTINRYDPVSGDLIDTEQFASDDPKDIVGRTNVLASEDDGYTVIAGENLANDPHTANIINVVNIRGAVTVQNLADG